MMDKAFSNLLKYIDKLPHTKKEQVYQWVKRYVDPTSSVGGRLINEIRELVLKMVSSVPIVHLNTLFDSEKSRVVNGIVVKVALKPLRIRLTPFFIAPEKVMNGLHLWIVCSKATPCVNRLKS